MSTTPRVPSAVDGQPPTVGRVLAHQADVFAAYDAMYAHLWGRGGVLEPHLKELARLRNARITDCGL